MLQFYFLSILLNVIGGLIFIYAQEASGSADTAGKKSDSIFLRASDEKLSDDVDALDGSESEKTAAKMQISFDFLGDKTFRLVVGILSGLVGILKLLSPIQYDIPIIGDLIPALAGMAACVSLMLDYCENNSDITFSLPENLSAIFVEGRRYLGIFCIIAAVLHFIFPRVLFL